METYITPQKVHVSYLTKLVMMTLQVYSSLYLRPLWIINDPYTPIGEVHYA